MIEYLFRGLSRDARLILALYYYENLTMQEIGHVIGVHESRVSQIHADCLSSIKQRLLAKEPRLFEMI